MTAAFNIPHPSPRTEVESITTDRTPALPALGTIAVENIAEFWLGGEANRRAAEKAADEYRNARGWK